MDFVSVAWMNAHHVWHIKSLIASRHRTSTLRLRKTIVPERILNRLSTKNQVSYLPYKCLIFKLFIRWTREYLVCLAYRTSMYMIIHLESKLEENSENIAFWCFDRFKKMKQVSMMEMNHRSNTYIFLLPMNIGVRFTQWYELLHKNGLWAIPSCCCFFEKVAKSIH